MKETKASCTTYLRVVCKDKQVDEATFDEVERQFKKYTTNYTRKRNTLKICENTQYDVDVNVMIRKTIKDFVDKCEELKALADKFDLNIYLEIVPEIVADSYQPNQILSLDDDIIAFLYKSSTKLDLDYYVL
jgi:hypothetical protein